MNIEPTTGARAQSVHGFDPPQKHCATRMKARPSRGGAGQKDRRKNKSKENCQEKHAANAAAESESPWEHPTHILDSKRIRLSGNPSLRQYGLPTVCTHTHTHRWTAGARDAQSCAQSKEMGRPSRSGAPRAALGMRPRLGARSKL